MIVMASSNRHAHSARLSPDRVRTSLMAFVCAMLRHDRWLAGCGVTASKNEATRHSRETRSSAPPRKGR